MSFLKNIMRPFVDFDEKAKPGDEQGTTGKVDDITDVQQEPAAVTAASPTTYAGSQGGNSQYQKHFDDIIEEANAKNPLFQGTDFKEFIDSKADVEGITDEASRYRTAFNVLKRTGLTKEKLANTGREYLKIIDHDITEFESAYVQQYKASVEGKEQTLQKKSQELEAINQKILSLTQEIRQLSQEIVEGKERLNVNKNAFVLAGQNKKQEIENELRKIDEYFS